MLRASVLLFALTTVAAAQRTPVTESDLTAKLTSDLLSLHSVLVGAEPLDDAVYSWSELQSLITYSQNRVVQAYQNDISWFEFAKRSRAPNPPYARNSSGSFASPDQAYKLTRVLAGKELTEENLTPLAHAITGLVLSAISCRESECPIQDSPELRDAAQQAYDALKNLGVSNHDTRVVIDAFLRGSQALASKPRSATTIFR